MTHHRVAVLRQAQGPPISELVELVEARAIFNQSNF